MAKIKIPDNATNGDVVKILFDNKYIYNFIKTRLEHFMWWDTPYKSESAPQESEVNNG